MGIKEPIRVEFYSPKHEKLFAGTRPPSSSALVKVHLHLQRKLIALSSASALSSVYFPHTTLKLNNNI